eukprot:819903-Prymnesium_polylepis.1
MTTNALHRQARRRHFSWCHCQKPLSCFDPGSTAVPYAVPRTRHAAPGGVRLGVRPPCPDVIPLQRSTSPHSGHPHIHITMSGITTHLRSTLHS